MSTTSLGETLAHIQEAESVAAVAVIDSSGMIVAAVPAKSDELENIAANAAGMLGFLSAFSAEAALGETHQAMVEYAEGTLFIGPLDEANILLVLAEAGSPLGQVRLILRRHRPEIQEHLSRY